MSADEQKRWEYEMRQKAIRNQRHMLASGRREGEKIGEERGLREGERKGKLKMACRMMKDEMPEGSRVLRFTIGRASKTNRIKYVNLWKRGDELWGNL